MYLDGRVYLDMALLAPILPYGMVALFGVIFTPSYAGRSAGRRVRRDGIDAIATVLAASDTGVRFTDGVHRQYRMKLTLQIDGHPASPCAVGREFMVSEFDIHRRFG